MSNHHLLLCTLSKHTADQGLKVTLCRTVPKWCDFYSRGCIQRLAFDTIQLSGYSKFLCHPLMRLIVARIISHKQIQNKNQRPQSRTDIWTWNTHTSHRALQNTQMIRILPICVSVALICPFSAQLSLQIKWKFTHIVTSTARCATHIFFCV